MRAGGGRKCANDRGLLIRRIVRINRFGINIYSETGSDGLAPMPVPAKLAIMWLKPNAKRISFVDIAQNRIAP